KDHKNKIRTACAKITPAIIRRVRKNFMRRIALCLEENDGYIEHIL
ncbi:hypothetical protein EAG_05101, partial [Camponotus floridanus]